MSMTLTQLPAITSPVTVAQAATLSANVAAIRALDNRETLALSVLAKIYQLNHAGGTDYRANHKQLRIDATSLLGEFAFEAGAPGITRLSKIKAVLDWNAAYTADATIGTDVNALVNAMAGMRETPEATLMLFYYFLLYKLAA